MTRAIIPLALAVLVLLAGCSGGGAAGTTSEDTPTTPPPAPQTDDGEDDDPALGVLSLYVTSDDGTVEEFERLNVTVSRVAVYCLNESDMPGTTIEDPTGPGHWMVFDVGPRTVDLTDVRGETATLLSKFRLSAGPKRAVFFEVSTVEGIGADGTTSEVSISSERLTVDSEFEVRPDAQGDFVFALTLGRENGGDGYVLKPSTDGSGAFAPDQIVNATQKPGSGAGDEEATPESGPTTTMPMGPMG